jgi:hypothetical protein
VQANAALALVNWDYQFKPGQYQWENKHWFSYTLKNQSGKAIKLIDGSLQFTDLLGEQITNIRLDKDKLYPAGADTPDSGDWDINMFEKGPERLADLKHEDVKVTLVIRKVVFADNSVWNAAQN